MAAGERRSPGIPDIPAAAEQGGPIYFVDAEVKRWVEVVKFSEFKLE